MKIIKLIVTLFAAALLVTSCGVSIPMTSNANLNETTVVLSQDNFKVVNNVSAEVSQTYIFGIGGLNKKSLEANAVAELTAKANLQGSQALINITVKTYCKTFLGVYTQVTYRAEGTVIEFMSK